MLKTFMKDNKISLAKLTSPNKMIPPSTGTTLDYYQVQWKQKPMSEPIIAAPRSPTYKRRKIFERINSPQSKITADFGEVPNFSTVQSYQIPQETQQKKTPKRTMKINKENGLCLARAVSKQLQKEMSRKSLQKSGDIGSVNMPENNEHLEQLTKGESRRQKRVEELERYNRDLQKELTQSNRKRERQEGSLIIVDSPSDNFTFQSQQSSIPTSSLTYSYSRHQAYSLQHSIQISQQSQSINSPLDSHLFH